LRLSGLSAFANQNILRVHADNQQLRHKVGRTFLPARNHFFQALRACFARSTGRCGQRKAAPVNLFAQAKV
jgi:hypothetical protein